MANAGTGTLSGLVVGTITYGASQPTGWLTAALGGTAAPATLTLTVAKGALPQGLYTATVPITSTTAGNSPPLAPAGDGFSPSPGFSMPTGVKIGLGILGAAPLVVGGVVVVRAVRG